MCGTHQNAPSLVEATIRCFDLLYYFPHIKHEKLCVLLLTIIFQGHAVKPYSCAKCRKIYWHAEALHSRMGISHLRPAHTIISLLFVAAALEVAR